MTEHSNPTGAPTAAPGWYEDASGTRRWWDGQQWSDVAPVAAPRRPWSGLSIAAFVVSLVTVVLFRFSPMIDIIGGAIAVVGAIFGMQDTATKRGRGLAIAALVIGIVMLLFGIFFAITTR